MEFKKESINPGWLSGEIGKLATALVYRAMRSAYAGQIGTGTASFKEAMTALDCLCAAIGRKLGRPFVSRVSVPGLPEMVLGQQCDEDDTDDGEEPDGELESEPEQEEEYDD